METEWRHPQPELWIALREARPIGIVSQRRRHTFTATAVTGRSLGLHDSLEEAQRALERAADESTAPSRGQAASSAS